MKRWLLKYKANFIETDVFDDTVYAQNNWIRALGDKATISDIFMHFGLVVFYWKNRHEGMTEDVEELLRAAGEFEKMISQATFYMEWWRKLADEKATEEATD